MNRTKRLLLTGASIAALGAGGAAIAGATGAVGGDDGDNQATGPGADSARQAALAITGGTANSVERDGENGATWEVEVTKPDGNTVDVRLDAQYKPVVIEGDNESADKGESESAGKGESESQPEGADDAKGAHESEADGADEPAGSPDQ